MFRHQLAAYSPITPAAIARACLAAARLAPDQRPALRRLLLTDYAAQSAILCGSGTQALQLAITLASRAFGADATVALPAFSCFDVGSAAVGAGVPVALYDLDAESLSPDLASLERVLSGGARVIVVSPLFGLPIDWGGLVALAERFGAVVVEDAAQGHGARWDGRRLGTLAPISTLSFGRGKGWTGGHGGAVLLRGPVTGEPVLSAEPAGELSVAVALIAQWLLGRPSVYGIPRSIDWLGLGATRYRSPREPVLMSRAAAAAVLANRPGSLAEASVRRDNAEEMSASQTGGSASRLPQQPPIAEPGYLRFPVRLSKALVGSEELLQRLSKIGVERAYPSTLGELGPVRDRLVGPEREWPGAESLAKTLVTLPTHSLVRLSERNAALRLIEPKGLPSAPSDSNAGVGRQVDVLSMVSKRR